MIDASSDGRRLVVPKPTVRDVRQGSGGALHILTDARDGRVLTLVP